ncbi:MAG: hypothetical protein PHF20_05840 [Halothiobacillaceae bacterium]|nr:hypothetical protein [Halothiobacillaceae bacterium]
MRNVNARLFPFDWLILPGIVVAALSLHILFDIPGRFYYENRGWDIPTDAQQKAAYDYAHNLKLPDSVPKPQPFNFPLARLKALVPGQPDVSTQYFNHLCNTESGEYVFKTASNVEGVFQMRPRGKIGDTPLDFDRYALEEPTGVGWSQDQGSDDRVFGVYILPMYGKYTFMERPNPDDPNTVIRAVRAVNNDLPVGEDYGHHTAVRIMPGVNVGFSLRLKVGYETVTRRQARYGYTWRGIQRDLDRRYSIGAGEYLIVDLDTNEVLAAKRRFKQSGYDRNTSSHIWWSNARPCENEMHRREGLAGDPIPINYFVAKNLKPIAGVNDQFIPEQYRNVYQGDTQ